ncbi:MAG: DUF4224 domain-containing protein [Candidatus Thiodiazotropha endolucinida]
MLVPLDDLKDLTGYSRRHTMTRWLIDNGWLFAVAADGWPKVAIEEFNRHMVGDSKKGKPEIIEPKLHLS